MPQTPNQLRQIIAATIRACRIEKFPGRGGSKRCAEAFGVSPQQWSPWECGLRTPGEKNLQAIADFFGKPVEKFCRPPDSSARPEPEPVASSDDLLLSKELSLPEFLFTLHRERLKAVCHCRIEIAVTDIRLVRDENVGHSVV